MALDSNDPRSRKQTRGAELERRCLELRARGASQEEISLETGLSQSGVSRALSRAVARLDEEIKEQARDYVAQQVARLEVLEQDQVRMALDTSREDDIRIKAGLAVLKTMGRLSRLLGFDAPTRSNVQVSGIDLLPGEADLIAQALTDEEAKIIDRGGPEASRVLEEAVARVRAQKCV